MGTSVLAAVKHRRRGLGCEIVDAYYHIALERVKLALDGKIKTRPMYKPIYDPQNPRLNLEYENKSSK